MLPIYLNVIFTISLAYIHGADRCRRLYFKDIVICIRSIHSLGTRIGMVPDGIRVTVQAAEFIRIRCIGVNLPVAARSYVDYITANFIDELTFCTNDHCRIVIFSACRKCSLQGDRTAILSVRTTIRRHQNLISCLDLMSRNIMASRHKCIGPSTNCTIRNCIMVGFKISKRTCPDSGFCSHIMVSSQIDALPCSNCTVGNHIANGITIRIGWFIGHHLYQSMSCLHVADFRVTKICIHTNIIRGCCRLAQQFNLPANDIDVLPGDRPSCFYQPFSCSQLHRMLIVRITQRSRSRLAEIIDQNTTSICIQLDRIHRLDRLIIRDRPFICPVEYLARRLGCMRRDISVSQDRDLSHLRRDLITDRSRFYLTPRVVDANIHVPHRIDFTAYCHIAQRINLDGTDLPLRIRNRDIATACHASNCYITIIGDGEIT